MILGGNTTRYGIPAEVRTLWPEEKLGQVGRATVVTK
jgi:hypothetical protein